MKKTLIGFMVMFSIASLLMTSLEARGRRSGGGERGGRNGGGRFYHGGHTMNRTPSMSRASSRLVNRSSINNKPVNRSSINSPSSGTRDLRAVHQRPSTQNHEDLRNQVNRYTQNRPFGNINRQDLSARNQKFSRDRKNQIAQNRQLSDRTSDRLRHSWPDSHRWFDRNFFDRHDIDVGYLGNGANLWRPAAWATLATWGAWNWSTPYYYDDGGYSYPVTPSEYSTYSYPAGYQSQAIVPAQDQSNDWLPLGVFAVASTAVEAIQSDRFIQLAINRNGEIDGVYYNSASDKAQDLAGKVDQTTQKAYWSLSNKPDSPIASTGIYNLTEDETPVNVHFSDGTDQTWTLVRIQQ